MQRKGRKGGLTGGAGNRSYERWTSNGPQHGIDSKRARELASIRDSNPYGKTRSQPIKPHSVLSSNTSQYTPVKASPLRPTNLSNIVIDLEGTAISEIFQPSLKESKWGLIEIPPIDIDQQVAQLKRKYGVRPPPQGVVADTLWNQEQEEDRAIFLEFGYHDEVITKYREILLQVRNDAANGFKESIKASMAKVYVRETERLDARLRSDQHPADEILCLRKALWKATPISGILQTEGYEDFGAALTKLTQKLKSEGVNDGMISECVTAVEHLMDLGEFQAQ